MFPYEVLDIVNVMKQFVFSWCDLKFLPFLKRTRYEIKKNSNSKM